MVAAMKLGALDDPEFDNDDETLVRFVPPVGSRAWPPADRWTYNEWMCWLNQHGWDKARVERYLQVDRYTYGWGFRRHEKEPMTWFYLPVPAAIPLHASKSPNVLYGGAAGGTKSHSTRNDAYRHCLAIPNYRSILMRRTHEELKRSHIDKLIGECERVNHFFGNVVMDYIKTDHELNFRHNGSKIVFGHCQNAGDEEKYLSDEYDDFRPDEAATFEKLQIVGVSGRLRSTKAGIMARLIATSNPGGAHTLWLKRWFIDRLVERSENPRYRAEAYQFIGAKLYDNPYLMDPDGTYSTYEERLYAYSKERRRQLLNGDWTAITGQFFPEFSDSTHVANLDIPEGCKIERWIDWGYSPNPGVCHWVACFPNGRLYIFAEWVFNGEGRQLQVASAVADRINDLTVSEIMPRIKGRLSKSIGDPSMWAKDGHTGESYEETFRRHGVRMIRADNDRVPGWGRFRAWLRPHPEGGRWAMWSPDCAYAIRTLPGLVHSKTDPEDLDTSSEDHSADADRYGFMGRPTPTRFGRSPARSLSADIRMALNGIQQRGPRPFGKVS